MLQLMGMAVQEIKLTSQLEASDTKFAACERRVSHTIRRTARAENYRKRGPKNITARAEDYRKEHEPKTITFRWHCTED